MHKFATLLSSSALIFGMATASLAADLPSKAAPVVPAVAPFNWTGFYLGVNGGCGTKQDSSSAVFTDNDPGSDSSFVFTHKSAGGCFGGVQGGYNYQFSGSPFVIGIEADWQGGRIQNRGSVAEIEGTENETLAQYDTNLKEFATVRGRLGYSLSSANIAWLLYATGGWAWGRNEVSGITDISTDATFVPGAFSQSQNISGWAAGAGVEAAVNRNWSVKFEYLYLDFGSNSYNGFLIRDDGNAPGPLTLSTKVHTVRLGLNYRFGDWWVR